MYLHFQFTIILLFIPTDWLCFCVLFMSYNFTLPDVLFEDNDPCKILLHHGITEISALSCLFSTLGC